MASIILNSKVSNKFLKQGIPIFKNLYTITGNTALKLKENEDIDVSYIYIFL